MSDDRPNGQRRPRRDDEPDRPPRPRQDDARPRDDQERERRPRPRQGDDQERRPRPREDREQERRPEEDRPRRGPHEHGEATRQGEERPLDALAASRLALEALQSLTSRTAEGVIGVERTDEGGWLVVVELLEASRVPATSDVLGEYEVEIGADRSLRSYSRRSRYTRASTMSD